MKKIFLVLSMLTVNIHAMDLTPNNKKEITDLMYVPETGTFYSEIGLGKLSSDNKATVTNSGLNYSTSDTGVTDLDLTVGMALEGNLFIFTEVSYNIKSTSDTTYGDGTTVSGTTESSKSSGLADPSFNARYRMIEQQDNNFLLDFELSFSPKTGNAESASTTLDGNNYRGGSEGSVSVNAGRKFNSFSFSVEADLTFNGSRDVRSLDTWNTVKISSHTDFSLTALTQIQPNKSVFLNFGLSYGIFGEYDQVSGSSTSIIDTDSSLSYVIAAGYRLGNDVAIRILYQGASLDRDTTQGTTIINEKIDVSEFGGFLQVQF